MPPHDFKQVCDDLDAAVRNADTVSARVKGTLDEFVVPGKPVPVVNGKPLPQKVTFRTPKEKCADG